MPSLENLLSALESDNVDLKALAHDLRQYTKPVKENETSFIDFHSQKNEAKFEEMKILLMEQLPLHPELGTVAKLNV